MTKGPVSILLLAGFALAILYGVIYFTAPPSSSSGAFMAAPGAGALFAAVVAVLALVGLWQSHAYKKMQ